MSVEAAFCCIDVLTSLLSHFPPASSRGKTPTIDQWEKAEKKNKVSAELKQEMKYNLLPESYTDRFNELETNWTQMSKQKFLAKAQKCKEADKKDRQS